MVCIYCASPTSVVNSRLQKRSNTIWRRRLCSKCANIFTTTELPDLTATLRVPSKNNQAKLLPFNRDKLFLSIYASCKHRSTALTDAASLTSTVIQQLLTHQKDPALVERHHIALTTHELLQRFDKTAGAIYLAYHPRTTS
jgi:transcriptional repressor NrdR